MRANKKMLLPLVLAIMSAACDVAAEPAPSLHPLYNG